MKIELEENKMIQEVFENDLKDNKNCIIAAKVNNEIVPLNTMVKDGDKVELLDITDKEGMRIYQRGLLFVMGKAFSEILPETWITVQYQLSNALYFTCEKVERLGIYDSLSKSRAQEVYNTKYLEVTSGAGKKPTVGETQAMSENEALYDKTLNDVYNRAYKVLKSKVAAAETMVSTLSKVLSHRMQESQMTVSQTERVILNEGNTF